MNQAIEIYGAPGEIRTPDPQIRSLVLYPAELRVRGPPSLKLRRINVLGPAKPWA